MPVTISDPRSHPRPTTPLPKALVVSNGDTTPVWALICPNPACGDVDTLVASYIDVVVPVRKRSKGRRFGRPTIEVFELACTECGERCAPPLKAGKPW